MNTTMNGSSCSSPLNPTAEKVVKTFTFYLIFIVSLVGNSFIGIVVYKTQTLTKPINYFIVNMAMSDLLYPIFWFPWYLTVLFLDSWPIGGSLGQALCKLGPFLGNTSVVVSIQSLVLIAVDRFGAVHGISSSFPAHQFKDVFLLYSCHMDRCDGCPLSRFIRLQTC